MSSKEELSSYPELLQLLLEKRGIKTQEDAEVFLNPDYERDTHDPFLLHGMERVIERILRAVSENERVVIYSDYDADGIPGAIVLHDFFKKIGFTNFENYIPHRNEDGFGLHEDAIDKFTQEDTKLIITVDCGIADVRPTAYAKEKGIDVIITDHHVVGEEIPDAYAIINPQQKEDKYPNKNICGAGVAFKLVQALAETLRKNKSYADALPVGWEKWLLDMVGIATLSDMVPLIGENRAFAHFGLRVLRKSRRPGLRALLQMVNIRQEYLTEDDVVFMISPRINAASRMDRPEEAFRIFATDNANEASELAMHLDRTNSERKSAVARMVKEIRARLDGRSSLPDVLVVGSPKWKPGLAGLAASAIVDAYGKPAFVWGGGGEDLKGSCRSNGSIDIGELMEGAKDVFEKHGGHKFSGGFSVSKDSVHMLEECLNKSFSSVSKEKTNSENEADTVLSLRDVTWDTYDVVKKLGPFGVGNPKPSFLFESVVVEDSRFFGKKNNHVEITIKDNIGVSMKAVRFFVERNKEDQFPGRDERANVVAALEKSAFGRGPGIRLRIVDIIGAS